MQFLNDSNHFIAIAYFHEWITGTRAASSDLQRLGLVIRYSTFRVIVSYPYPIDSLPMLRLCGITCGRLFS
jgi:hypothetical protein